MKFFIIEILDMLFLALFFLVLDCLKKYGEFDKYILLGYIIIFKNSLIYFYLFKNKLNSSLFYIFRIVLLLLTAFSYYFLDSLNFFILDEIISFFSIIGPGIFLVYLIIKKDISNKGIKIISLFFYEILLIYLSIEIAIAIGYQ